jgi:hypothetical protein
MFSSSSIARVLLGLPAVLEILGLGVLERWSIGVLKKRAKLFSHYSSTPVLQHSENI